MKIKSATIDFEQEYEVVPAIVHAPIPETAEPLELEQEMSKLTGNTSDLFAFLWH